MIPRIANLAKITPPYTKYLQALESAGFKGEIEASYSARLLCATDNSVYQKLPQAVLLPYDKSDVCLIFKLAKDFPEVVFAPRGGGTGTNGQSLSSGIIIDLSRHFKAISDLNVEERSVVVEAGVIKDELNEQLAPHKLFFSPELSTSARATIGGMISNDAAGQGSLKYGRTSEHIKEVEVVLMDGTLTTFKPITKEELSHYLDLPGLEGEIYRECYSLLKDNAKAVTKHFPKLNRFLTGYDLQHAYDPKTGTLNLARLICGAEGTLATVVAAKLDLTLMPSFRALAVVKYENFDSALRHAQVLIKAGAFSVETVDSKVLSLAKNDPVWLSVQDYIQEVEGADIQGVNLVEFNGYEEESERALLDKLFKKISNQATKREAGVLGVQIADTKEAISAVYGMRKKAVGLLGSAAGSKKLVAFTEDTAVPPEHLADYILEFRALLDGLEVDYGMFGHVDTGLMHVRPALDLTLESDKQKLITISNSVVELVKKYGGQMWGEHGRGYRSCYGEVFFGELYPLARKVKGFFDKDNRLNPGKICVPFGNEIDKLVALDDPMRGDLDRLIDIKVRESFEGALNCNGNGQCFSYSRASLMCPSYRYSKERAKSPKGYSALMRDWLRLMQEREVEVNALEQQLLLESEQKFWPRSLSYLKGLVKRTYNSLFEFEDFNHEYLAHVSTCLACKSCKSQCPAHVNAAELNSRFLQFYYSRYLRPRMDWLCLHAEQSLPYVGRFPRLMNKVLGSRLVQNVNAKVFNFVDVPRFSEVSLVKLCHKEGIVYLNAKEAISRAAHFDAIIVADIFSASYEASGIVELAKLAKLLGQKVAILKPYVNGKLFIIRGARSKFIRYAREQAERLNAIATKGTNLVGYDPALTICYRDEYPSLLQGKAECKFKVLLIEEYLQQVLSNPSFSRRMESLSTKLESMLAKAKQESRATCDEKSTGHIDFNETFYLFCHCTEQALVPVSVRTWQEVLAKFKLSLLPIPVACCGMAGLFGHMRQNQDESKQVYAQNWQPHFASRKFEQCLVTGFSCRSQVARMEQKEPSSPVHVLYSLLSSLDK